MIMNEDGTYGKDHSLRNYHHNSESNFDKACYYVDQLASLHLGYHYDKKAINYVNQSHMSNSDKQFVTKLIKSDRYDAASLALADVANHE